jgi:hypothetical protein
MKIEKRITDDDLRKDMSEKGLFGDLYDMVRSYQLQALKDMRAADTEFEIIQPKLLDNGR